MPTNLNTEKMEKNYRISTLRAISPETYSGLIEILADMFQDKRFMPESIKTLKTRMRMMDYSCFINLHHAKSQGAFHFIRDIVNELELRKTR